MRAGGLDFHLAVCCPDEAAPLPWDRPGSRLAARGRGLIRPQGEQGEQKEGDSRGSRDSTSMASELRMTRKCVLWDGVMVSSLRSVSLSFLLTWKDNNISNMSAQGFLTCTNVQTPKPAVKTYDISVI